jgi:hypothetical protein
MARAGRARHAAQDSPRWKEEIRPRYRNHSLRKALKGGRAATESTPGRMAKVVRGMRLASPPRASMLRVPVACNREPAPKNSRPLNREWFQTWNTAPAKPRAVNQDSW